MQDEFFEGRIAAEMRLWEALDNDLLCPFHYFGVPDGTDLTRLNWRSGTYDQNQLGNLFSGDLARARAETTDARIRYDKADLERLQLPAGGFDLVYSSLAFHYIKDFAGLLINIRQALKPGGRLIFSIEHPIYMAPRQPEWLVGADGGKVWPLNAYQIEGPRVTNWLVEGVVKQHRTMSTTLNLLIKSGFTIAHVEEWSPSDAELALHPEWAIERERPMFLLISTRT